MGIARKVWFSALLVLLFKQSAVQATDCNDDTSLSLLHTLKQQQFEPPKTHNRDELALVMLNCIGHPDPKIRDETVYEAYQTWLRNSQLSQETRLYLFSSLINKITMHEYDDDGYESAFAALILAEVVRVDRIAPYLQQAQRQLAVTTVAQALRASQDFRGFDDKTGWRHLIAHLADVHMQLALNEQVSAPQLQTLLNAILTKVAPTQHFYHYGEPQRLAMPVLYMAYKGIIDKRALYDFIEQIAKPKDMDNWQFAYKSNDGLAQLHNTRAFLYAMFVLAQESKSDNIRALLPSLSKALHAIK